ncbi:MAG TPA: CAP domain-containing protein [Polyangiaceae bacterium]|nr:CAP domain-containing protein [Polyangiaceae bacterium]
MASMRTLLHSTCIAALATVFVACSTDDDAGDSTDSSATGGSGSGDDGSDGGGDTPPAEMEEMLSAHNDARASVDPAPAGGPMPALAWSGTVAAQATSHAEKCKFEHSSGSGYGENIYATSGTASPADVVGSWVSEVEDYDYASNSCADGAVCGHYTQVVWAKSLRLGCAAATCTQNSPFGGGEWQFWVCNYDPPGNFNGEPPY